MKQFFDGLMRLFWVLSVFSFIAVKVGGTVLAAWSWWWLLLAQVPVLVLLFSRLGVL